MAREGWTGLYNKESYEYGMLRLCGYAFGLYRSAVHLTEADIQSILSEEYNTCQTNFIIPYL